jgi:hypothetical protein
VEREIPKLATYLGHIHVNETYWYEAIHRWQNLRLLLEFIQRTVREGSVVEMPEKRLLQSLGWGDRYASRFRHEFPDPPARTSRSPPRWRRWRTASPGSPAATSPWSARRARGNRPS